jgi:hypothetical protein
MGFGAITYYVPVHLMPEPQPYFNTLASELLQDTGDLGGNARSHLAEWNTRHDSWLENSTRRHYVAQNS